MSKQRVLIKIEKKKQGKTGFKKDKVIPAAPSVTVKVTRA